MFRIFDEKTAEQEESQDPGNQPCEAEQDLLQL